MATARNTTRRASARPSPDAELFARIGATRQAMARRLAATAAMEGSSGISGKSERQEKLLGQELQILERVAATRARTITGAQAVAVLAADYAEFEPNVDFGDWDLGVQLLLGAPHDLKRLAGAPIAAA
jgi:hypothetical protein